MTGVITSLPPLVEQPPGSNASNPAGLPGVTYTAAVPNLPQTWSALQTFLSGDIQFSGSTSGNTFLNATAIASGTLTLPATTDTLVARNTVDTLTNKTLTSPVLTSPSLGAATATSLAVAGVSTFDNVGGAIRFISTDATAIPVYYGSGAAGGGAVSFFTAGVQRGSISNTASDWVFGVGGANQGTLSLAGATSGSTKLTGLATASGILTLPSATDTLMGRATTDTLTNKTFDTAGVGNNLSINGVAANANTGTGAIVRATSPTLVTPALGAATAASLGVAGVSTFDNVGSAVRFISIDATALPVYYGSGAAGGGAVSFFTNAAVRGTISASAPAWTFGVAGTSQGTLALTGATGGSTTITALAAASGTLTLPSATDTLVGKATTDILTNKTIDTATSTIKVGGVTVSAGQYLGTGTNDSATAGNIGQYISLSVPLASAVSLVATTATNITSISLPAGDWDVSAVFYNTVQAPFSAVTTWLYTRGSISLTSATMDFTAGSFLAYPALGSTSSSDFAVGIPAIRLSLAATTTVYLVEQVNYTGGSVGGFGLLRARRIR